MQYIVIESTAAYFTEHCENMLEKGWQLQGGVNVVYLKKKYAKEKIDKDELLSGKLCGFYYQAFIHYSDDAKIPDSVVANFVG